MTSKKPIRVVFMGTPEFAVTILDTLVKEQIDVCAVVTVPDKPAGRGQKIHESAVKQYAVANNLRVLQPEKLKDEAFVQELESLEADLFVVVAFRMLPEIIWAMPPKGTINLHASLLPAYRGAAPINWAIINGETQTGVTTFFIEKEIDTGKIIDQSAVQIGPNETVGELYERLMQLGAEVMHRTILQIEAGKIEAIPQDSLLTPEHKPAPKIFKEDCQIAFDRAVKDVHNFCRGLSPYPAAWCRLENTEKGEIKSYKIFGTFVSSEPIADSMTIRAHADGLYFPCQDNYLVVTEIQPEGKRKMTSKEFLAGNSVENLVISSN